MFNWLWFEVTILFKLLLATSDFVFRNIWWLKDGMLISETYNQTVCTRTWVNDCKCINLKQYTVMWTIIICSTVSKYVGSTVLHVWIHPWISENWRLLLVLHFKCLNTTISGTWNLSTLCDSTLTSSKANCLSDSGPCNQPICSCR